MGVETYGTGRPGEDLLMEKVCTMSDCYGPRGVAGISVYNTG